MAIPKLKQASRFLKNISSGLIHLEGIIKANPDGTVERNPHATGTMRLFHLNRSEDETGVSGTGTVGEGVVFSDAKVCLNWLTMNPSTTIFNNLEDMLKVHGHQGKTTVEFVDTQGVEDEEQPEAHSKGSKRGV